MMIIGLTADSTSLQDLRTIADWTIRPRLLSTGGVAQVAVIGGDIKEYQILLDPARMKYYNIGLDEVLPVVENMNQNATGGILYEYGNEYIIQGVMATTRVEEIGKAVIKTVDDFPITLADIANVQIGAKTPKLGVASEKGKPAVLVTVTKQPGTNTLELTDKLDASIQELRKTLPEDVEVSTDIFRQSRFINSSIHNIQEALLEGFCDCGVVLFPDEFPDHDHFPRRSSFVYVDGNPGDACFGVDNQYYEFRRFGYCYRLVGRRCDCGCGKCI